MDQGYVTDYRERGYGVIRGVFSPGEVAGMARAFDRIYAQGQAHGRSYRDKNVFFNVSEDDNLGKIMRIMQWPAYFEPVLDEIRRDRRMLEILRPLIGDNLKKIINQLHWKPPGAAMVEFGYHQDIRSRRPRSAYRDPAGSYIQTGIAIDPHGRGNGGMTLYAGSHLLGELPMHKKQGSMYTQMTEDHIAGFGLSPDSRIDLELDPGDVALWNVNTIHGSGPNESAIDRRLYLNGYVIAENCDRGEWTFRNGEPCDLGEPVLVHYEDLHVRPEPHYVDA